MQLQASKTVVILALLVCSLASTAQSNNAGDETYSKKKTPVSSNQASSFAATVEPETATSVRIIINNPQHKKLRLKITHMVSGLVKDTIIDSENYNCMYNFGKAEDGLYRITVRNGKEKFRKNILLNTETTLSRSLRLEE